MRTPGPTSPLVLRGSSRTRWAQPAGRCRLFIRLSFHDAGTYQPVSHAREAHGSIHLSSELAREENAPLHVWPASRAARERRGATPVTLPAGRRVRAWLLAQFGL